MEEKTIQPIKHNQPKIAFWMVFQALFQLNKFFKMKRRSLLLFVCCLCCLMTACSKSDSKIQKKLKLFGIDVGSSNRDEILQAIEASGGILKDSIPFCDTYDSSNLLSDSRELTLIFNRNNNLAIAEYSFPAFNDVKKVDKVREMIEGKYGKPTSSKGTSRVGPVTYKWKLDNGFVITVARGWPNTSVALAFCNEKKFKEAQDEIEDMKKEAQKTALKKQESAF